MKRNVMLLTLALGLLASSQAMAQSHLGLRRAGAAIGYVSPENLDGTVGLGVFADMGTITPEISLEPRLDYWSESQSAFGSKVTIHDVTLGARAKYNFSTSKPNLRPFAGAGLGLHFLHSKSEITVPGFPTLTAEGSDTKLGLDLGGGVATTLSPRADLLGEMWYGIVSDVSQFSLRVGVSYKLGS